MLVELYYFFKKKTTNIADLIVIQLVWYVPNSNFHLEFHSKTFSRRPWTNVAQQTANSMLVRRFLLTLSLTHAHLKS